MRKKILANEYEEEKEEVQNIGDREHRTLQDDNLQVTFKTHLDATRLFRKFLFAIQSMLECEADRLNCIQIGIFKFSALINSFPNLNSTPNGGAAMNSGVKLQE